MTRAFSLLLVIGLLTTCISALNSVGASELEFQGNQQDQKDKRVFKKLETDLRKDLEDVLRDASPSKSEFFENPPLNVRSLYDRFRDITTVSITLPVHHAILPPKMRASGALRNYLADVDISVAYSFGGERPIKPVSYSLILQSSAKGPLFGREPSLIFLADDQRLRMGSMQERVVYHEQGIVDEFVAAEIPSDSFAMVANSNVVEVQIGNIDFSLSDFHLKGFRMIAGIPEGPVKPPAKAAQLKESAIIELQATKWRGEKFSAEFKRDGEVVLEGWFAERIGTWRQQGDRVEMTLPAVEAGQARVLGIGILKDDKMALRFKVQSLFGGSTMNSSMQIAQ
jgi:hypothetical protein